MNHIDPPAISHVEIYHKLGKLEGLMEVICNSNREFSQSVKDLHQRIDTVEARISPIEQKQSSNAGSVSTITLLVSLVAAPVLVGFIVWHMTRTWDMQNNRSGSLQAYIMPSYRYLEKR